MLERGASEVPAATEESEEQAVARAAAKKAKKLRQKAKKQQAQQPEEESQQQQQQQHLSQKQQSQKQEQRQRQRHQMQEEEEQQAEGKTGEGPSHSTAASLELQARRQHEAEVTAPAPRRPAQATAEEDGQSRKAALSEPDAALQAPPGPAASMPHLGAGMPALSPQPASSMLTSASCTKHDSATNCVPSQVSRPAPGGVADEGDPHVPGHARFQVLDQDLAAASTQATTAVGRQAQQQTSAASAHESHATPSGLPDGAASHSPHHMEAGRLDQAPHRQASSECAGRASSQAAATPSERAPSQDVRSYQPNQEGDGWGFHGWHTSERPVLPWSPSHLPNLLRCPITKVSPSVHRVTCMRLHPACPAVLYGTDAQGSRPGTLQCMWSVRCYSP